MSAMDQIVKRLEVLEKKSAAAPSGITMSNDDPLAGAKIINSLSDLNNVMYRYDSGMEVTLVFEAKGYRDVIWCPLLNEPAFLEYDQESSEKVCPNCNGNYEPETHPFLVHVGKPRYD
jgi:hypothetical protein